ncbi:MAG: DUF4214 domain-containing protein [Acidimicrobiales bacterium]|nr:DUF4214 domain-containing protein [Acidimicrobiales bacterium]
MDAGAVILEDDDRRRPRRRGVWLALVALLVALLAAVDGPAGAEPDPVAPACADGSAGEAIALPSGATATRCEAVGDGTATNPTYLSITLDKTVGTTDACAATDEISVAAGTTVYYCYTVTNEGSFSAWVHDLEDDQLGQLLAGHDEELAPGASTFVTASATIFADTVNVATWYATDGTESATDVDTATVTISGVAVPGAPTIAEVAAGEGTATVRWDAPVSDGGSAITSYVVTPYVGAVAGTPTVVDGAEREATLDGLANGTEITVTVAATNGVGTGPESAASAAVTPQWWLPWSTGPVAVDELFRWFTGSPPTAGELAQWLGDLDAGTALPGDLVAALRDGADATDNVDPVIRLYSAYFLRIPDLSGTQFWLNRRRSGWTLARISANFAGSSEFLNTYGALTNRQFVELIYQNVLGRPGDPAGIDFWTRRLDAGVSRGQVMLNFSESNEYRTGQASAVDAAATYLFLLGRAPTVAERDAFVADLEAPTPLAVLVRALIATPALAARAG